MAFDLLTITIVGFILEVLCVKFGSTVFYGTPFICISFLMVFIAVVRWNLYGLIIAPILVLATIVGGRWSELPYLAAVYDYRIYISVLIGLLSIGLNVIIFKKYGTAKITVSWYKIVIMIIINYLIFSLIQVVVYRLLSAHTLMHNGKIMYEYINKDDEIKVYNLCRYGESGFVYDLFGLIVGIVGTLILRSQGVVCNALQKSIEDRKNAELDRLDRENFSIDESVNIEEISGEISSNKDEDSKS